MKLLLSPHNDDESLFASYIALREKPKVIVALDGGPGHKTRVEPEVRVAESAAAIDVLGCEFEHYGFPVDIRDWDPVAERLCAEPDVGHVWAPVPEPGGHRHHNRLAAVALRVFGAEMVSFYSTYRCEESGWPIRTDHGYPVETMYGWASLKHAALSCYVSQIEGHGTRMHFERPLDEYEMPELRLNLGGGLNAIEGYANLDKTTGWRFEDGLECFPDASVAAITISHALMYVDPDDWPNFFSEIGRVMRAGGTVRITEDAIGCPGSGRPLIRPGAKLATNPQVVLDHLSHWAEIDAKVVGENETRFSDKSLIQQNYGHPPDVFHAEGVKAT